MRRRRPPVSRRMHSRLHVRLRLARGRLNTGQGDRVASESTCCECAVRRQKHSRHPLPADLNRIPCGFLFFHCQASFGSRAKLCAASRLSDKTDLSRFSFGYCYTLASDYLRLALLKGENVPLCRCAPLRHTRFIWLSEACVSKTLVKS